MELLVKRDPNNLVETDGRVIVENDIPNFLKTPRVVPQEQVEQLDERSRDDDLLIADEKDIREMDHNEICGGYVTKISGGFVYIPESIPGLWSGYRSALVQDVETGKWYRLKGVSLNPENPVAHDIGDGCFKIEGGQIGYNAEFERAMSNRFNRVLESEGIEPVMQVKGFWKYPQKVRNARPTASIVEVKGDTRLDELMWVLDGLSTRKCYIGRSFTKNGENRVSIGELSHLGERYRSALNHFYYDIGFVVGRLKRLMDRNNQTWSSDHEQTNAHVGNIVLYNGSDKVKVGLVDFDSSCDIREFLRSELRSLQERERKMMRNSALKGPISPRQISGKPFLGQVLIYYEARQEFVRGFDVGYESRKRGYSNEVDLGELQEIFALLRQEGRFSFAPAPSEFYNGRKIEEFEEYNEKISLEKIIEKQYYYQKGYSWNN